MSLSKGKCWYSNNCLHFLKCIVPLTNNIKAENAKHEHGKNTLAPTDSWKYFLVYNVNLGFSLFLGKYWDEMSLKLSSTG